MKRYLLRAALIAVTNTLLLSGAIAQRWTKKADVPGLSLQQGSSRIGGTGFSIGEKGYIGLGYWQFYPNPGDPTPQYFYNNDLWEYDPATDAWTQKANFPGAPRISSTAFSLNGKGYIGLGYYPYEGISGLNDFWEYDPVSNTWTQKNYFEGDPRYGAASFTIDGKGYVATGYSYVSGYKNDLWEYDPATDDWTQRASVPGVTPGVRNAFAFSSGSSGFLGGGELNYPNMNNVLQEYTPASDSWMTKAAGMPGGIPRKSAIALSFDNLPGEGDYVCVGMGATKNGQALSDLWRYNLTEDTWTLIDPYTGRDSVGGSYPITFFAGSSKGYISSYGTDHFYEFDPLASPTTLVSSGKWEAKASFGGQNKADAKSFTIGEKGYILAWYEPAPENTPIIPAPTSNDLWEYDPASDSWTQKASLAGIRTEGTAFAIENKGYAGLGQDAMTSQPLKDLWEYDPLTNNWTQKADLPGDARLQAFSFAIGKKGYIGAGFNRKNLGETYPDIPALNDLWEYDPLTNTWAQKADVPGAGRMDAFAFAVNGKGYAGGGYTMLIPSGNQSPLNDFYEYNPLTNTWTTKTSMPGPARYGTISFTVGNKGYTGLGLSGHYLADIWGYSPATDTWTLADQFKGGPRYKATAFTIGNQAYIGTGSSGVIVAAANGEAQLTSEQDIWAFTPDQEPPTITGDINTTVTDYEPATCNDLSGTDFLSRFDNNGNLVFLLNPNENELGATCWGVRKIEEEDHRDTHTWFGGTAKEYGAYLSRNFYITPSSQPQTSATVVLVFPTQELQDFIDYFNAAYGKDYTIADIRIEKYDGPNQDLDLSNNSDDPADYREIVPVTGTYGTDGEYTYLQFTTSGFSEFAVALTSVNAVLPVKLTGFTARLVGNSVKLQWQTSLEQNASHFNIQRSVDGLSFQTIGKVTAAGNSNTTNIYSYVDETITALPADKLYYRLEQMDQDNKREYSPVAAVDVPGGQKIVIRPNPVKSGLQLIIKSERQEAATLQIRDISGRTLQMVPAVLHNGANTIPLDMTSLSKGIYFLTITAGNKTTTTKFIKQ